MNQSLLKGIVLAGGKSLRFGADKALVEINGVRLIEKPVRLLKSLGLDTVVIANATRNYTFLDCRIENDLIPEKGPLGGLYTAFQIFPQASLLVLTCDMPNMTKAAIEILVQAQRPVASVTLFKSDRNIVQPFPGIYSHSIKNNIDRFLSGNELSMQAFLKQVPTMTLISPPADPSLFTNINFREDLSTDF